MCGFRVKFYLIVSLFNFFRNVRRESYWYGYWIEEGIEVSRGEVIFLRFYGE